MDVVPSGPSKTDAVGDVGVLECTVSGAEFAEDGTGVAELDDYDGAGTSVVPYDGASA